MVLWPFVVVVPALLPSVTRLSCTCIGRPKKKIKTESEPKIQASDVDGRLY